ncbi:unnamed protein product [Plutella xylostella]|uniref:(diamondback moth) hypothetical protein n=1 Tax=Plutella xylostella TaxID=51655 RepID=A0A8S4FHF1_PLUXY|nr:unnamed protein product [Plutella xylostella]
MATGYLVLLLVAACWAYPQDVPESALGKVIDRASMKVLKEAFTLETGKNVVSSPLGMLLLLSQYSAGLGDGALKQEITSLLSTKGYSELVADYGKLSNTFSSLNPNFLSLKNKIYVADGFTLDDEFSASSRGTYRSEIENLKFTEPSKAAAVINEWAEKETHGNIKNAVSPDALSPDVAVAMFNVIYFKGQWEYPFTKEETKEKDFHLSKDKKVKKSIMHVMKNFRYHDSELLGAQLAELPYQEEGFRMIVALPHEVDGLPSVVEKVAQNGLLGEASKLEYTRGGVCLELPKFNVDSDLDFEDILKKVGLSHLFTEPATKLVKNQSVVVSKAFQKAFIKVDEEGSTAGAFSGMIAVPMSSNYVVPDPVMFHVDRPFFYAILHQDVVVFAGTYTH